METEAAFLADIRAHPDDDAPRLVFADWLEEHGEEGRAELIRLECRMAKLPSDDPALADLKRRREKLDASAKVWSRPLERQYRVSVYRTRRGLPASVFIYLNRWRRN